MLGGDPEDLVPSTAYIHCAFVLPRRRGFSAVPANARRQQANAVLSTDVTELGPSIRSRGRGASPGTLTRESVFHMMRKLITTVDDVITIFQAERLI